MASGSKKVIYAALIGNLLIAITKFIAGGITGSSAMFSEGVHSLVDTGNQGLLLLGLRRAGQAPDATHPYGYGKEVYFWSFVVAIMIFAVGSGVSLYEGIHRLLDPHPVAKPIVNYIVLALAIVFEGVAWKMALNEFQAQKGKLGYLEAVRRGKDPTNFVVLFEDSAAMLGLIIALAGVALGQITGDPIWDGVAATLIGIILALVAIWLAFETKGLLIGESARREVVEAIQRLAGAAEHVEAVGEVLTLHMGPNFILVNLNVGFADVSADEIEHSIAGLDREIKYLFPDVKRVFIEAEAMTAKRGPKSTPRG